MEEFLSLAGDTRRRVDLACPKVTMKAREAIVHAELATIYGKTALACKRAKQVYEEAHYAGLAEDHWAQHATLTKIVRTEADARYAARQRERAERQALRRR